MTTEYTHYACRKFDAELLKRVKMLAVELKIPQYQVLNQCVGHGLKVLEKGREVGEKRKRIVPKGIKEAGSHD